MGRDGAAVGWGGCTMGCRSSGRGLTCRAWWVPSVPERFSAGAGGLCSRDSGYSTVERCGVVSMGGQWPAPQAALPPDPQAVAMNGVCSTNKQKVRLKGPWTTPQGKNGRGGGSGSGLQCPSKAGLARSRDRWAPTPKGMFRVQLHQLLTQLRAACRPLLASPGHWSPVLPSSPPWLCSGPPAHPSSQGLTSQ